MPILTRWSNIARTRQLRSVTWFFIFTGTFRMKCQATRTTRASLCNWLTFGKMSLVIMGRGGSTFPGPTWMNSALSYQLSEKREPTSEFRRLMKIPSRSDQGIIPHWLPTPQSFATRFPSRIFGDHCGWFVSPRRDRGVGLRHVDGFDQRFSRSTKVSDHAEDHRTQPNRHDTSSSECVYQSFGSMIRCGLRNIKCRNQPTVRLNPRTESVRC